MLASRGGMEQEPLHSFILLQAMAVLRPVYPTEAAQSGHNGTKNQGQRSYSSINRQGCLVLTFTGFLYLCSSWIEVDFLGASTVPIQYLN